jgi:hypothetical protein
MSFYKNSEGDVAKLMRAGSRYVVMFQYENRFFPDVVAAGDFLKARGFYKRGF